jgi:glycerol-3-phosphate O-acyltransferase/dihydroxyacetone phosphate acyltransferase
MDWLDDKNIFNWSRTDDSDMADDVFFFLDKFYGNISGRSRSGSVSESDSRSASRVRSRANSISSEGFKVESMTSLPPQHNNIPDLHVEDYSSQQLQKNETKVTSRRIFRIDDVDEDDDEEEEHVVGKLAVPEEAKKDV